MTPTEIISIIVAIINCIGLVVQSIIKKYRQKK